MAAFAVPKKFYVFRPNLRMTSRASRPSPTFSVATLNIATVSIVSIVAATAIYLCFHLSSSNEIPSNDPIPTIVIDLSLSHEIQEASRVSSPAFLDWASWVRDAVLTLIPMDPIDVLIALVGMIMIPFVISTASIWIPQVLT